MKLARNAQADGRMEVDVTSGDVAKMYVDASNLRGVSAIQISPALSDVVPSLNQSPSFKMARTLRSEC